MSPNEQNNIRNEFQTPTLVKLDVLKVHLLQKQTKWYIFIMADGDHIGFCPLQKN